MPRGSSAVIRCSAIPRTCASDVPDAELTQLADRLGEIHLALVHLDPELLELALHIARRDRAVELVLLPDLDGEAEPDLGDAGGLGLGGAPLLGALPGDPLRLVRDP